MPYEAESTLPSWNVPGRYRAIAQHFTESISMNLGEKSIRRTKGFVGGSNSFCPIIIIIYASDSPIWSV